MGKPSVRQINEGRLGVLERRARFVRERAKASEREGRSANHDLSEAAALEWAVRIVKRYLQINAKKAGERGHDEHPREA